MQTVSTIGFDIAKSAFQVHGVDVNSLVVIRRQLKRRYVVAFSKSCPALSANVSTQIVHSSSARYQSSLMAPAEQSPCQTGQRQ
jgi:hypothetical protein